MMMRMKIMLIILRPKKNKTIASKSFEYKTKIIIKRPGNNSILDTEVAAPLK